MSKLVILIPWAMVVLLVLAVAVYAEPVDTERGHQIITTVVLEPNQPLTVKCVRADEVIVVRRGLYTEITCQEWVVNDRQ